MARKAKSPSGRTEKLAQVNAHINPSLARRLRIKLAAEGITYRDWLEMRIKEYVPRIRLSDFEEPKK